MNDLSSNLCDSPKNDTSCVNILEDEKKSIQLNDASTATRFISTTPYNISPPHEYDKYGIHLSGNMLILTKIGLRDLLQKRNALNNLPIQLLGKYHGDIALCSSRKTGFEWSSSGKTCFEWFEKSDFRSLNVEFGLKEGCEYTITINTFTKKAVFCNMATHTYFKWKTKNTYLILLEDDVNQLSDEDKAKLGLDEFEERERQKNDKIKEDRRKRDNAKLEERIQKREAEKEELTKIMNEIELLMVGESIYPPIHSIYQMISWFIEFIDLHSTADNYLRMSTYMLSNNYLSAKDLTECGKDTDIIDITDENMFPSIIFTREFFRCMQVYQEIEAANSPFEEYTRYMLDTTSIVKRCEYIIHEHTHQLSDPPLLSKNKETIEKEYQILYYQREYDRWNYFDAMGVKVSSNLRSDEDMMTEHQELWDKLEPQQQQAIRWFTNRRWDKIREEYPEIREECREEEISDLVLKVDFFRNQRDKYKNIYFENFTP